MASCRQGLIDNAQLLPQFYGLNWTMRIYHDKGWEDKKDLKFLNDLAHNFEHVDLCYIKKIPGMGDLHGNLISYITPTTP